MSIPFDVVKTRKQLHPKEYKNRSILSILQEVYENEGRRGLFLGNRIFYKERILIHILCRSETKSVESDVTDSRNYHAV